MSFFKRICYIACFSRIFILSLTLFGFLAGVSYDSSSKALFEFHNKNSTILESFIRWDSVYFLSIAQRGYAYEQEFAFFPGYPILMRIVMSCLHVLSKKLVLILISYVEWTNLTDLHISILSGLLVSNISFVLSAIVLYKLGLIVLKDEKSAFISTLFWILNPSGVFLSSLYSESLFAFLSFFGMLLYLKDKPLLASIAWGASSFVRGNGILYSGFFVWSILKSKLSIWKGMIGFFNIWIPFLGFQWYGYHSVCHLQRPFCYKFPYFIYSFVQKEYWNNGFLNYYELKQLPNFLLASPFLCLSLYGIGSYYSKDPIRFLSLGFAKQRKNVKIKGFYSDSLLPFVYLWMVLTIIVSLFMHVQIILRFFTSVPPLYWLIGHLSLESFKFNRLLLGYFVLYSILGTILFSNFYPPA